MIWILIFKKKLQVFPNREQCWYRMPNKRNSADFSGDVGIHSEDLVAGLPMIKPSHAVGKNHTLRWENHVYEIVVGKYPYSILLWENPSFTKKDISSSIWLYISTATCKIPIYLLPGTAQVFGVASNWVSNTPITLLGFAGLASFGVISLLQCGTSEKWLPENIHLTTDIFADKKKGLVHVIGWWRALGTSRRLGLDRALPKVGASWCRMPQEACRRKLLNLRRIEWRDMSSFQGCKHGPPVPHLAAPPEVSLHPPLLQPGCQPHQNSWHWSVILSMYGNRSSAWRCHAWTPAWLLGTLTSTSSLQQWNCRLGVGHDYSQVYNHIFRGVIYIIPSGCYCHGNPPVNQHSYWAWLIQLFFLWKVVIFKSKFSQFTRRFAQYHILLYFVWSPSWHLYILLLTNLLAFYLTFYLAFYLAHLLAFYLAYLLTFYLAYLLALYLAYLMAFYLAYLRAFYLTFYLAYLLAFYLAVEVQQCALSWEGPRLRSSGAHWAGKVPGWGPAVRTELGRSQVEVQRCALSWEGPRLRPSGAHWAGMVPGWGPAVRTELGSWRGAWRRVGKAEVEVEVDADMVEEKLEEEAEAEEEKEEAEEEDNSSDKI